MSATGCAQRTIGGPWSGLSGYSIVGALAISLGIAPYVQVVEVFAARRMTRSRECPQLRGRRDPLPPEEYRGAPMARAVVPHRQGAGRDAAVVDSVQSRFRDGSKRTMASARSSTMRDHGSRRCAPDPGAHYPCRAEHRRRGGSEPAAPGGAESSRSVCAILLAAGADPLRPDGQGLVGGRRIRCRTSVAVTQVWLCCVSPMRCRAQYFDERISVKYIRPEIGTASWTLLPGESAKI